MFALFKTDDGGTTYNFIDYLGNNESDKFVGNLLSKLGYLVADVKIFKYDKTKFKEYMKHRESVDTGQVLAVTSTGVVKKQQITQFRETQMIQLYPDEVGADTYYSAQEIIDYGADPLSVTIMDPVEIESQAEIRSDLEQIVGTEINVQAVIDAENV